MEAAGALACCALEGGVAVAVVGGAFFFIAEDIVGLADFLEFVFGGFVAGVFVGVEFYREFAVGFFDFVGAGGFFDAEHFVVVPFGHGGEGVGGRSLVGSGVGSGWAAAEDDGGGSEETVAEFVAFAGLGDDGSFREGVVGLLGDGVVEIGVEGTGDGDFFDALVAEEVLDLFQDHIEADEEVGFFVFLASGLEPVVEVIEDGEEAFEETGVAITGGFLHFAGHAFAVVVEFGGGAEGGVFPLGDFHEGGVERVGRGVRGEVLEFWVLWVRCGVAHGLDLVVAVGLEIRLRRWVDAAECDLRTGLAGLNLFSRGRGEGWRRGCGYVKMSSPVRSGGGRVGVMRRILIAVMWMPVMGAGAELTEEQTAFFETKVRPVLASACYDCHGPGKQKGGLRVDWREGLLKGGESGPAIVPGDAEGSLLVRAVSGTHAELKMPKNGEPLGAAAVADLKEWVRSGAPDPRDRPSAGEGGDWAAAFRLRREWWCWQPLKEVEVPKVAGVRHPVDRFLREAMAARGVEAAGVADAATLVRRAWFVLAGMPPTPEETARFLAGWDGADGERREWGRVVDGLLASPAFGERWARHWMDWLRYAESHGSEGDPAIPHAWQYRDYLIRALNADVPYFQLVREHLAGDLMEPRVSADGKLNEAAMGPAHLRMVFHGFTPTDALDEFVNFTDNQVDVVSKAFLGLTVSCARCHDHKFDAISQKDYYAMFGVFANGRPGQVDAAADPGQRALVGEMLALRGRYMREVLAAWGAAGFAEGALGRWVPGSAAEAKAAEGDGLGPLGVLLRMRAAGEEGRAAEWARLQGLRDEYVKRRQAHGEARAHFRWTAAAGGPGKVYRSGPGFEAGGEKPLVAVGAGGDEPALRFRVAGEYSDAATRLHRGVFQSERFESRGGRVWVRASGRNASVRLVIRNYPRAGLVYPKTGLDHDEMRWVSFDLDYWKGETVHIEVLTNPDHPVEAGGGERAWIGVSEIFYPVDAAVVPFEPAAALLGVLDGEVPGSMGELENRYGKALRAAVAGRLDDETAGFLNAAMQRGLLGTEPAVVARVREEMGKLEGRVRAPVRVPGVMETDAADWPLYVRGDIRKPGEAVPRGFLSALDGRPYETAGSGRLELAERIAGPGSALAARVVVNRLWHHVFGRGLVATTDNFGKLGELPSHPELLDWLAGEFLRNGGSIKAMLRLLVTSEAFLAQSAASPAAAAKDPDNALLSHWTLRRLEAEAIRDAMVAMTGRMEPGGGPGVEGGVPRRSVYVRVIRNAPDAFLTVFDAPIPSSTRGRRDSTNVPAQALTLMNAPLVQGWAREWAERVAKGTADRAEQVRRFYVEGFQRVPSGEEVERSLRWMEEAEMAGRVKAEKEERMRRELAEARAAQEAMVAPVVAKLRSAVPSADTAPAAMAEWDFEGEVSAIPLRLHGGAKIEKGALVLNGRDAWASTGPLGVTLRAKTLEAWVTLSTLEQAGGGVFTVQDLTGTTFDAVVFGEQDPRQWLAGSNVFARTKPAKGPPETDAATRPVHVAITWAEDGTIRLFRDGLPYGRPYKSSGPVAFAAGQTMMQLGCRHGNPEGNRLLSGSIHRARLYDRALSAEEVGRSAGLEGVFISRERMLEALTPAELERYSKFDAVIAPLEIALAAESPAAPADPLASFALALLNAKEFIYLR